LDEDVRVDFVENGQKIGSLNNCNVAFEEQTLRYLLFHVKPLFYL